MSGALRLERLIAACRSELVDLKRADRRSWDAPSYLDCYCHERSTGVVGLLTEALWVGAAEVTEALEAMELRGEIRLERDGDFLQGVTFLALYEMFQPPDPPPVNERRGRVSSSSRSAVLRRDNFACVLCGATDDLTIDHIFPTVEGGSDDPINLRVLCRSCNCRKGAHVPAGILGLRPASPSPSHGEPQSA